MFFLLVTLAAHHRLLYISAFREAYDDAPGTQNERLVSAVGAMNNEARLLHNRHLHSFSNTNQL